MRPVYPGGSGKPRETPEASGWCCSTPSRPTTTEGQEEATEHINKEEEDQRWAIWQI